jgi:hypothetical protein
MFLTKLYIYIYIYIYKCEYIPMDDHSRLWTSQLRMFMGKANKCHLFVNILPKIQFLSENKCSMSKRPYGID